MAELLPFPLCQPPNINSVKADVFIFEKNDD